MAEHTPLELEMIAALDPFARVARIMHDLNLPDDEPLRDCAPGIWPTIGDCRRADAALSAASGRAPKGE